MIDKTLSFLLGELNAYLYNRFRDDRARAVLSAVVKQDGTVPEETTNKIVLTLINIEREAAAANAAPQYRGERDNLARVSQNAPRLPRELEKLSFQWVDMDLQAINNLWSVLGSHYLPSVVYKARLLTIQDAWIQELTPPITGVGVEQ